MSDEKKEHFLDLNEIKDLSNLVTAEYKFYKIPPPPPPPKKSSLRLGITWVTGVIILS